MNKWVGSSGVEHGAENLGVEGSIPSLPTTSCSLTSLMEFTNTAQAQARE